MKLGIIGLSQAGKTTDLQRADPRQRTPTTASAGRIEVHTAVVDVPDPRVDRLSGMFKPRKTIYAKVTYADIAGLESGAAKSGISGQLLNQLTQMDGFLLVVRAFADENVAHPSGTVDPGRDLEAMTSELLLNDLIAVERKLERLLEERKKGGTDKVVNERQTALFTRLHEALNASTPLRKLRFSAGRITRAGLLWPAQPKTTADGFQPGRGPEAHRIGARSSVRLAAGQIGDGDRPVGARGRGSVHAGIRHPGTRPEPDDPALL